MLMLLRIYALTSNTVFSETSQYTKISCGSIFVDSFIRETFCFIHQKVAQYLSIATVVKGKLTGHFDASYTALKL